MADFKPFQALRPIKEEASLVAALPYDVVTKEEACEIGEKEAHSFIHVDCAEIDLEDGINPYEDVVYQKAAENLRRMEEEGILKEDEAPCYYIYQLTRTGKTQTGIVGVSSIDDYENGIVKKHEFTRKEKEEDRIRHVECCKAQTGPIFLAYRESEAVQKILKTWIEEKEPIYDFVDDYEIAQKVWKIDEASTITALQDAFLEIPALYIADGHHRAAAAVKIGKKKREENPDYTGDEAFNHFLAVAFPKDELTILPYNRVVKDLHGLTVKQFLGAMRFHFELMIMPGGFPCLPLERHCMGMYVEGQWYHIKAWPDLYEKKETSKQLDVEILQSKVLKPILGIEDPRTSNRISFVGGHIPARELAKMADETGGVAFVMFPTSMEELMDVADHNQVMPPKSTWFEPKLRSGLFIHKI